MLLFAPASALISKSLFSIVLLFLNWAENKYTTTFRVTRLNYYEIVARDSTFFCF